MEQKKFIQILSKYRSGNASPEEEILINEWFEAMGEQNEGLDLTDDDLEKRYWAAIARRGGITEKANHRSPQIRKRSKTRLLGYSIGIAASVLIMALSYSYFNNQGLKGVINQQAAISKEQASPEEDVSQVTWKELTNTTHGSRQFTLADGSTVTLKPQSQLKLSSDFNKTLREVYLKGEGYFEVTHNKNMPFIVYTEHVTTKVLGTSFTVKALQDDRNVTVTVRTGKVSVLTNPENKAAKKTEVILTPNQELVYNKDKESVSKRITDEPQPLIGLEEMKRIRFENRPVPEIFRAIEKIYGIDIVFDEAVFSSCKLTTSVTDRDLFSRLDIISSAIGATYTRDNDKIVFSGTGCKN